MLVPLVQVEALGLRSQLDDALRVLQRLQCVEVVARRPTEPPPTTPGEEEDLARLARVTRLLERTPAGKGEPATTPDDAAVDTLLDDLETGLDQLDARATALAAEADGLPRHLAALVGLQPLIPELSKLDDGQLAQLGLASIALVLEDPQGTVVPELGRRLAELLGPAHLLVTSPPDAEGHVGAMLVLGQRRVADVHALLGTERIAQSGIPDAYTGRSLRSTVAAMRERLAGLPQERRRVADEATALLAPHSAVLAAADRDLRARRERRTAARAAARSEATFALRAWVPAVRVDRLQPALSGALGDGVVVYPVEDPDAVPPVLLRNRPGATAFQNLVGSCPGPRPGRWTRPASWRSRCPCCSGSWSATSAMACA